MVDTAFCHKRSHSLCCVMCAIILAHGVVQLAVVYCETTHSVCRGDNGRPVPPSCCMMCSLLNCCKCKSVMYLMQTSVGNQVNSVRCFLFTLTRSFSLSVCLPFSVLQSASTNTHGWFLSLICSGCVIQIEFVCFIMVTQWFATVHL